MFTLSVSSAQSPPLLLSIRSSIRRRAAVLLRVHFGAMEELAAVAAIRPIQRHLRVAAHVAHWASHVQTHPIFHRALRRNLLAALLAHVLLNCIVIDDDRKQIASRLDSKTKTNSTDAMRLASPLHNMERMVRQMWLCDRKGGKRGEEGKRERGAGGGE